MENRRARSVPAMTDYRTSGGGCVEAVLGGGVFGGGRDRTSASVRAGGRLDLRIVVLRVLDDLGPITPLQS
jgi:hypothetical protein